MLPRSHPLIAKTRELQRDRTTEFGREAFALCHGVGIEVGAVNCPFDVEADVFYMDQHDSGMVAKLHAGDPNVGEVLPVTFVSPRPPYPFLATSSFDFIIASHVLEHVPNPPLAIAEFLRIVKPGGIVYMVVPHMHFSFDRNRPVTPLSHFCWEYFANVTEIDEVHYFDHVFEGFDVVNRNATDIPDMVRRAQELHKAQTDFHIHTFTETSFWDLARWTGGIAGADLIHTQWNELNIHAALKKRG